MEDYIKKAADAFLVERPYGMRVDYSKRAYSGAYPFTFWQHIKA